VLQGMDKKRHCDVLKMYGLPVIAAPHGSVAAAQVTELTVKIPIRRNWHGN